MKIVIDIPEELYEIIQAHLAYEDDAIRLMKAVRNGTRLPEGHGGLYSYNDLSSLVEEDFTKFLSRLDLSPPKPIIETEGWK